MDRRGRDRELPTTTTFLPSVDGVTASSDTIIQNSIAAVAVFLL